MNSICNRAEEIVKSEVLTILENMWYGNIHPVEEFVEGNAEYKNLLRILARNRGKLEATLSPNKPNCLKNNAQQQMK